MPFIENTQVFAFTEAPYDANKHALLKSLSTGLFHSDVCLHMQDLDSESEIPLLSTPTELIDATESLETLAIERTQPDSIHKEGKVHIKHLLRPLPPSLNPILSPSQLQAAQNLAFVFDIDGVLLHGSRLIPSAAQTLQLLNGSNPYGIKIPYIFLTNNSGTSEQDRVARLSNLLGVPVSTSQFIQSHTPMRALAKEYKKVLVLGGEGRTCVNIAESYGFQDVIHPDEIIAWDPTILPFSHSSRRYSVSNCPSSSPRDFSKVKIDAILVLSDSRDYARDMQLCIDLLTSGSVGGGGAKADDQGLTKTKRAFSIAKDFKTQQLPIYFSQGDLLCPSEHPSPRMSQGTFIIALRAQFLALTGQELRYTVFGKPERVQYGFADGVLGEWAGKVHGESKPSLSEAKPSLREEEARLLEEEASLHESQTSVLEEEARLQELEKNVKPKNIYMIGDNPSSDILGANRYGWNSCLVKTGVFQGTQDPDTCPEGMVPSFGVFENVYHAVTSAIAREVGGVWIA